MRHAQSIEGYRPSLSVHVYMSDFNPNNQSANRHGLQNRRSTLIHHYKPAGNMLWVILFFLAATFGFNACSDVNNVSGPNGAPVAKAGPDQGSMRPGTLVTLNGSGSSDPNGNPLTYRWSFITRPPGSAAVLSSTTSVSPTFTLDLVGDYVVQLIVNDGTVSSPPDTVLISSNNVAPVADAGPDQGGKLPGALVTLDGSESSDGDGDSLTYSWSFTSKPASSAAVLSSTTSVSPTFTVDRDGTYTVQLIVNDGTVSSAPDSVLITSDNVAPVANAGPDQGGKAPGSPITLNGSGSSDANGDPLTYSWLFVSKPAGSAAVLANPTSVSPTFVVDLAGNYVVQLIVNDGTVSSAPNSVLITTNNVAPVANAGPDQGGKAPGALVTLNGSGSSDANGDPLTFSWSLSRPAGSTAVLANPTSVSPTFTVDRDGTYTAQLIVNDGTVNSAPNSVNITATNAAPVANAGPDQGGKAPGTLVTLNGSGSSDANGDPLTFSWSLSRPAGSTAVLANPTSVSPTFTVDRDGTYTAQLIVNDGTVNSAPNSVLITATNAAPVANAGPDQGGKAPGTLVTLNGSGSSDANGDPLTYSWSLSRPAGSTAVLANPTSVSPTFTVDRDGTYTAQLIVNDGTVNSAPNSVLITATNAAPVANAGPDQGGKAPGTLVTLNGSGSSDANGDPLTYSWSLSRPAGSTAVLANPTSVSPTFTVDRDGTYTAQLIVNDGTVNSAPNSVLITATNAAPVANAGPDQGGKAPGTLVTLNGSGSSDANGDPLTFSWSLSQPAGSTAVLSNPTSVSPTFTVDVAGTYTAQLIVNDGTVNSAPNSVLITTNNVAPVANAGPDQGGKAPGTLVTLNGSGSSDANGDPLTYSWSLSKPAGSAAVLANPTSVSPTFTVDVAGTYTAQLIVNDGTVNSAPNSVLITTNNVAPVANAGPDQGGKAPGALVTLNGSGSSDANGDPLTYSWSLSKPAGSAAVLANPTSVSPTFTVDVAGTYTAQLIVNDGTVNSAPNSVLITTNNVAPVANAGPDQLGLLPGVVILDGSGSSDANGNPLTYSWTLLTKPDDSLAVLLDPTSVSPTFILDLPGDYVVQLIVNDGTVDSAPDSVTITTN